MRKGQRFWIVLGVVALMAAAVPGVGMAQSSPPQPDGIGVHDPVTGEWFLRDGTGQLLDFYYGDPNDVPFMGDWDCDGIDTPGLYRSVDTADGLAGKVYLRNSNTQGIADIEYFFGNPLDVPLAGDWNGDGCDTISLYRPSTRQFFMENSLGSGNVGIGAADYWFTFGEAGDVPFAGDFDSDGVSGIGVRNPLTGVVSLRQTATAGAPDSVFAYGDPGDLVLFGDWDNNPTETIGIYRPAIGTFYLNNGTDGAADLVIPFGNPNMNPLAWSPAPDNAAPTAADQGVTTPENKAVAITLIGSDPDGDPVTFAVTSMPAHGSLSGVAPSLTYTPDLGFEGLDSFAFNVSDGLLTSNTATVTVTVTRVEDAPDATDDGPGAGFTTDEDSAFTTANVLDNDTDLDLDVLSVSGFDTTGTLGTVVNNGDGTFTYTPAASFNALAAGESATDAFTYVVTDGNGGFDTATVTITVTGVNDALTAKADGPGAGFTTDEDTGFTTASVLDNDTDPDTSDVLAVSAVDVTGTLGTVVDNGTGTFTYTPAASFNALAAGESLVDSFSYTASDGNGGTDTATVTITVTGVNDAPTANPEAFATLNAGILVVADGPTDLLFNDTDPDTSEVLVVGEVQGSAANVGVATLTVEGATVTVAADGSFTYDPSTSASLGALAAGATLDDTFTYAAADGSGGSDTATVTVTVSGVRGAIYGLTFEDLNGDAWGPEVVTEIIDDSGDGLGNTLDLGDGHLAIDASGAVFVPGLVTDNVFKVTSAGVVTEIIDATGDGSGNTLDGPHSVAVDASGNVFVSGRDSDNVFKIASGGAVTEIIDATGDGLGNALNSPRGLAVDSSGNLYVTGHSSNNVFMITPGGAITQIIDFTGAGGGNFLQQPQYVTTNGSGAVYVSGALSSNVLKYSGAMITEIIDETGDGTNPLTRAAGLATDASGNVFVAGADSDNVFKIAAGGAITEIIDATGSGSRVLERPRGIATDAAGNVFVTGADSDNVFKVTSGGVITEILDRAGAGSGTALNQAAAVSVSGAGDIYVGGGVSNNVLKVTLPSEPLMNGVEFTLTGGDLVSPLVTTSDANGEFGFVDLAAGTYTVTETVPTGYASTTGFLTVIELGAGEVVVADRGQATVTAGQILKVSPKLRFGNQLIT